jgi:hypothetical protein
MHSLLQRRTQRRRNILFNGCLTFAIFLPNPSFAAKNNRADVPEEYETVGGHALAFGGSVVTAIGGVSAIRCNPAMLALEKEYSLNGSYNWPSAGRDFYQLGIIDGKTSPIAAGFSYSSAMDQYQGVSTGAPSSGQTNEQNLNLTADTPAVRRASLAVAMPVGRMYLGFGSSYVEAKPPGEAFVDSATKSVKGFTMGFGAVAHVTPQIRLGLSAENLANRKLAYVAPTFYRAGASYFLGDFISLHLDYRKREAVDIYEGRKPAFAISTDDQAAGGTSGDNLINISSSIKVYDLLRLVTSAGQNQSSTSSSFRAAAGVSLINQNFNFSYQVLRADLVRESVHHAVSLGVDVSI